MGELRQAPSHGPGLEAGCLLSLKAEDRHPGAPSTYLCCSASGLFSWAWLWHGGLGTIHAAAALGLQEDSRQTHVQTEACEGQKLDPTLLPEASPCSSHLPTPAWAQRPQPSWTSVTANPCPSLPPEGHWMGTSLPHKGQRAGPRGGEADPAL